MKLALLLLPPLVVAPTALAAVPSQSPTTAVPVVDDYQDLVDEYEDAIDDADGAKARRVVKKQYWSRFQAHANAGEGRAYLWMAENARYSGAGVREALDLSKSIYERLVKEHVAADWFGDAVEQIARERRVLGDETIEAMLLDVFEASEVDEVRAHCLYQMYKVHARSKDDERQQGAAMWLERIEKEFPKTSWAKRVDEELFVARHLSVGAIAPDFDAKTVDGFEFKLSDYRGKVVVMDFYGFW